MSSNLVRVPWVVGTVVEARPRPPRAADDPRIRCARKREQIEEGIRWLERKAAKYPPGSQSRLVLDWQLELQRRRLGWLNAAAAMAPEDLAARRRAVEEELGADGLEFAAAGLPADRVGDQRFEYGLCELALIRFVQGE